MVTGVPEAVSRSSGSEPLVSVREAAEYLGVRPATVYLWAELERIPSYKLGALRRFRLSELASHVERFRRGPPLGNDERSRSNR
jgi:excisionase family DNA binding protein